MLGAAAAATAALAVARRRRRAGKPQSRFRRVIADTSHARFQHLDPATQASASAAACTSDPAAAAPGSDASSSAEATAAPPEPHARGVSQRAEAERAAFQQQHPHAAAILRLAQELPLPGVAVTGVLPPPLASLEDTPLVMVRGVRQLRMLARRLKAAGRFAVDLEHNSFRSYLGLTSLMQISTGEKAGRWAGRVGCVYRPPGMQPPSILDMPLHHQQAPPARVACRPFGTLLLPSSHHLPWVCAPAGDVDYIVDVLVLHDHMHLLRDVFGDPDVLKVMLPPARTRTIKTQRTHAARQQHARPAACCAARDCLQSTCSVRADGGGRWGGGGTAVLAMACCHRGCWPWRAATEAAGHGVLPPPPPPTTTKHRWCMEGRGT